MSVSGLSSSTTASTHPLTTNTPRPQQTTPQIDADGDHDGDTAASERSKNGSLDVSA